MDKKTTRLRRAKRTRAKIRELNKPRSDHSPHAAGISMPS